MHCSAADLGDVGSLAPALGAGGGALSADSAPDLKVVRLGPALRAGGGPLAPRFCDVFAAASAALATATSVAASFRLGGSGSTAAPPSSLAHCGRDQRCQRECPRQSVPSCFSHNRNLKQARREVGCLVTLPAAIVAWPLRMSISHSPAHHVTRDQLRSGAGSTAPAACTLLPRPSSEGATRAVPPAGPAANKPRGVPGLCVGVVGGACGSSALTAGDMWLSPEGPRGRIAKGMDPAGAPAAGSAPVVTGVGGGARGTSPAPPSLPVHTPVPSFTSDDCRQADVRIWQRHKARRACGDEKIITGH